MTTLFDFEELKDVIVWKEMLGMILTLRVVIAKLYIPKRRRMRIIESESEDSLQGLQIYFNNYFSRTNWQLKL